MQVVRPGKHAAGGIRALTTDAARDFGLPMRRVRAEHAASASAVDTAFGHFAGTGGIDSCGVAVRGAALWTIVYA